MGAFCETRRKILFCAWVNIYLFVTYFFSVLHMLYFNKIYFYDYTANTQLLQTTKHATLLNVSNAL